MIRCAMNIRRPKIPISEKMRNALYEVGGEPLEGSGFESEEPELEFQADNLGGRRTVTELG